MARECVICMTDEDENTPLLQLTCGSHAVCPPTEDSDCLASFFRQATNEERLYPARCCDSVLFLDDYTDLPFDLVWAYQVKEREYSVPAKLRVYCVDPSCTTFLHPNTYEKNSGVTFAKCQSCPNITCTTCKTTLFVSTEFEVCTNEVFNELGNGQLSINKCRNEENKRCEQCQVILFTAIVEHKCEIPEIEKKFKITAKEKGYQECQGCGSTVELAEACNHITCDCGHEFCYRCGRDWEGSCPFGCPLYGAPEYDNEGYNQDGFHKETGRNRDGLTRADINRQNRDDDSDSESDQDEEEDDELAGLDAEARHILAVLDPEDRAQALEMIRIQQVENGDIVFREEEEENPDEGEDGEDEEAHEDENNDLYDEPEGRNPGEEALQDGDMGIAALYNTPDEEDPTIEAPNLHANEVEELHNPMQWNFGDENTNLQPSTQLEGARGFELSINNEEVDAKENVEFNVDLYVPTFHFPSGLNLAQYSDLRSTINEQDRARANFFTAEPTSNDEPEPMDID